MRARDRDLPAGAGARFGLAGGLVGMGDALSHAPRSLEEAIDIAGVEHGAKAGRLFNAFASAPDGAFVWPRDEDGHLWLGRLSGPWRYDDSPQAAAVGIHHVRATRWARRPAAAQDVPAAVRATFARGGRNFQRSHSPDAEHETAALWQRLGDATG